MASKFLILIAVFILRFLFLGEDPTGGDPTPKPMVVVDGWDLSGVTSKEHAFSLTDDSTMIDFEVEVLKDMEELPVAYTSYITTPVCDDSLCALMHIQMYWNLLGNYIGFDTLSGYPLTKNDHLKFRPEDYSKLHRLLMDDNSVIRRKEKKDLFDDTRKRVSEVVDAVTGATAKEIKEVVVDGALYSSYTIYHLVYGKLSDSIRSDMESRYTKSLQNKLLFSVHSDYQLYALKSLNENDFISHRDRILGLIHQAIPLNRLYIMKKMPEEMWLDGVVQDTVAGFYSDLDRNSMSWYLKKMESLDQMSSKAILMLIKNMNRMSRNQLKLLIRILGKDGNKLSDDVLEQIKAILRQDTMTYGYLVEEFLEKKSPNGKIEN